MYLYILLTFGILIAIYFILNCKIENKKWNFLFCLGLFPYIYILLGAIYSYINGSDLVGDTGGIDSALFVIVVYIVMLWYIYLPALILIIVSIIKMIKGKNNKL